MNKQELYQKRTDLIIDYISQILVYGANTNGNITIDKNKFDDDKYLILTVRVIKNSYFRWHDLGILANESLSFYKLVLNNILDKFNKFNISFNKNSITISSDVNNNSLDISFNITNKKEEKWFQDSKNQNY